MDRSNECTWPEMKLRAHYLGWLAAAIATVARLGLTFDLLVVKLTGGAVGVDLVVLVYLCAIASPSVYAWRKHGEACCQFLELEHTMQAALHSSPAGRSARFAEVLELIERIEATRGFDRQLVRNEAKAWLLAHVEELSRDERDYVCDHLGYLHRW